MDNKIKPSLFTALFALVALTFVPPPAYTQQKEGRALPNGIVLGYSAFLTKKQDIKPFYEPRSDAAFQSRPIISYQGKAEYSCMIAPRFDLSAGIAVGVYPFDFDIKMDSSFSITGRNFESMFVRKGSAIFTGFTLKLGYVYPLQENHFLSVNMGINYFFFITQWYSYGHSVNTGTERVRMFEAKAMVNPSEKAFFAPELSLRYHYRLGKHFTPHLSIFGVYSNNTPIVGRSYTIFGKNETLEGTFSRRFIHAGLEAGIRISM